MHACIVYVCFYEGVCTRVGRHACMGLCTGQRAGWGIFFDCSPLWFLRKGLSLNPDHTEGISKVWTKHRCFKKLLFSTNLTIFLGRRSSAPSLKLYWLQFLLCACKCLSACMSEHHMHAWSPWRPDDIRSLELVLQKVVSHIVGLEIEPGSSERGFSSLNQQAISLATNSIYWFISLFISFCLFLCFVLFEIRVVD